MNKKIIDAVESVKVPDGWKRSVRIHNIDRIESDDGRFVIVLDGNGTAALRDAQREYSITFPSTDAALAWVGVERRRTSTKVKSMPDGITLHDLEIMLEGMGLILTSLGRAPGAQPHARVRIHAAHQRDGLPQEYVGTGSDLMAALNTAIKKVQDAYGDKVR